MAAKSGECIGPMSKRALKSISQENILLEFFMKASASKFHPENNPDGVINMGTSENKLVMDILSEKLAKVSLGDAPSKLMQYDNMHGTAEFREALSAFLTKYVEPAREICSDDIYVFNGCGSVLELLGFAICDDGDSILIPAPYYGAFKTDLALRMGCVTVSIELSSDVNKEFGETEPFELSVGRMQHAYLKAISEGHRIRGIILANPNNPLGNVYSKSQLSSYLEFANKYKLHVILDEIYFLSIYAPDAKMTAGLSLSGVIDPDLLHVVWGFSKDFAISGFRCGLVHTTNKELAQVLSANAYFQSVPTLMQHILQSFIQDFDWLDNIYFPTNHERLRKAKEYASRVLESIGVPCFPSKAGLYLWVDLREFVKPLNKGGELALMESFVNNGVYVTASCAFYAPEPGWFRIIFSVAADELKIGMERVREVLLRVKGQGLLTSTDEPLNDGTTVGSEEGLDDLVTKLKQQINSNDWLQENTAEKWVQENEELAAKFLEQKKNTQFT